MDEYRHLLFFKADDLTSNEKKKIRRYFQKKRVSGGGECGVIENVGNNIYQICFKDKEDQERVLENKEHTVFVTNRKLLLTVSQTKSLDDSKSTHQPSTNHSQTSIKSKTRSLEKIFKLDIYLLYYLRDNLKAYTVLEKQLSAIGCTVELDVDKEEAVVRGDIEKGPGRGFSAAEKWELQVDRVFIGLTDTYTCHHVLEPKQIRIIQQDSSFETEDIKVYPKIGYSVVVGEVGAVKDRIAILEKSVPVRKTLPVVEKKFKLVEEEFSREMRAHYPEVRMLIENTMIILEGPDKEVQSGATKLEDLMKTVQERRVKLPTVLINFIQSSNCISKYQTRFQQSLRNPVSLDVGSDLVLTSLSSGALIEAEAAVQRDLTVDTVQLQGAAAVPPDLDQVKEKLIRAKKDANSRELRVDVSFIPGLRGSAVTKVRLVGYSEDVNKLKDVLQDYQMNEVGTQEVLNLPLPEVVDCLDEILDMIGMKQTKVTLKASHFPYPCVLVSGPRCLVQKVQKDLNTALGGLTSDTLVLKGPGAQRYFQEKGKVIKEKVQRSCQVLIMEQQQGDSQSMPTTSNLYKSENSSTHISSPTSMSTTRWQQNTSGSTAVISASVNKINLQVKVGSLVAERVNVLVSPMINRKLTSTKIGKCLLKEAGNTMQTNFDLMAVNGTICLGDVIQVVSPPSLGCSRIFFIECLPWDGVSGQSRQALGNGLKRCLELCAQQGWSSVAFPVIGTGVALKYPLGDAIQVLTEKINQFGSSVSSGSLSNISVVISTDYPDSGECYHNIYRELSSTMNQGGQATFRSLTGDLDDIIMTVGGGVKLQLVFGDIVKETTDVVVNTTDFSNFETDDVCRDILSVAGPQVKAQLKNAKVNRGDVFQTPPGSFPCKAILHVCGQKDAGVIEQLVCRIIQQCESFQYKSVAIPAICAGAGGLDPGVVAHAILQGVNTTTSSSNLQCLSNIRIVLFKINVFLAFKKEAKQMFPQAIITTATPVAHASQRPPPLDLSILCSSSTVNQTIFQIVGLCRKNVDDAMMKLKSLYQDQCSTQTFREEDLAYFTQDDVNRLKKLVELLGLQVEKDQSGQASWTVSGLKDGVDQMMQMIRKTGLERLMS